MKTKGALNKPKFALVQLSDLQQRINANTHVPVKISFLQELGLIPNDIPKTNSVLSPVLPEKTLQFTIVNPA